jgi:hypothetical protein
MLFDAGNGVADREARNEYLSDLDEAWEVCKDSVEKVRNSYEDALETARNDYDAAQTSASSAHRRSIDEAWATYKAEVSAPPTRAKTRHEVIGESREVYNRTVGRIRVSYDEAMSFASDDYARSLTDARQRYESAIDSAFAGHREATGRVRQFLEPVSVKPVDDAELAKVMSSPVVEADPVPAPVDEWSSEEDDTVVIAESILSSFNGSAS